MKDEIEILPDIEEIGYSFKNRQLLIEALTHPSYASEHSLPYNYQRLEFFGDSVIQIIITQYLYHKYPEAREGELTKMRSFLAQKSTLAKFALHLGLDKFIKLGRGEIKNGGAQKTSTLCNAFEALCGAIYLDGGIKAATYFLIPLIENFFPSPQDLLVGFNPKGCLQEFLQSKGKALPEYKIESRCGPQHAKIFEVSLWIDGEKIATGTGSTRKGAEFSAAEQALKILLSREEKNEIRN